MSSILVRTFEPVPYEDAWQSMQAFTNARTESTLDECWVLQHPPVFTLGLAGKREHILDPHHIPIVQSDRGGQVTYHGPGQLVVYLLIDLRRQNRTVRSLVCTIEQAVIDYLKSFNITATAGTSQQAPGVYVEGAKVSSLGLKIRRGCSFHGLSFNVNMDLEPFQWINPCGFQGLKVVQLSDWVKSITVSEVASKLSSYLINHLGYTHYEQR